MPGRQSGSVLDKTTRLTAGDIISVAVGVFGKEYAESRGARPWTSEHVRDKGKVIGRQDGKWIVKFTDSEHVLERKAMAFESRDTTEKEATGRRRSAPRPVNTDSSNHESSDEETRAPQAPTIDSSDEDIGAGKPEHDGPQLGGNEPRAAGDWTRDDHHSVDERARHGFTDRNGPRISGLSNWESASLFTLGKHFLPMEFLTALAAEMTQAGLEKANEDRHFVNWKVTTDDLLQWIGVWMYMLSFPQACYFLHVYKGESQHQRCSETAERS